MIIKKDVKLTAKKLTGLTTSIIILITIIVLALTSAFLYKNFYQAITQSKEILILREKVAVDTVDLGKFNLIIDKLTKKTEVKELKNIISPFH